MLFVTIVSALAIVAALAVAGAHISLALKCRTLSQRYSQLLVKISNVDKSFKQSESAAVLAEVAALEGVVGKLAKSMRSQFGTIHAKIAALETTTGPESHASNGERPTRDELRKQHLRPPLPPTAE